MERLLLKILEVSQPLPEGLCGPPLMVLDPRSQEPEFHASIIELMAKMIPRYLKPLVMIPRSGNDRK